MMISALVLQDSPIRLWGLSSKERLRRRLLEIGGVTWLSDLCQLALTGRVLLLDGRLHSWLSEDKDAEGQPGRSFRVFGGTSGAYRG